jgi:hypothetical protein
MIDTKSFSINELREMIADIGSVNGWSNPAEMVVGELLDELEELREFRDKRKAHDDEIASYHGAARKVYPN